MNMPRKKVLSLFGTRPEVIKFVPILRHLEREGSQIQAINVLSGQHTDLLYPLNGFFKLRIDHDLHAMRSNQSPAAVGRRIVQRLLPVLDQERPDIILVQGDTSTALAGSLAGAMRRIPVGHVEAGFKIGKPECSVSRGVISSHDHAAGQLSLRGYVPQPGHAAAGRSCEREHLSDRKPRISMSAVQNTSRMCDRTLWSKRCAQRVCCEVGASAS